MDVLATIFRLKVHQVSGILFFLLVVISLALPFGVQAMGIMADLMCIPAVPDPCGCEKMKTSHGCESSPNRYGCDCWDDTAGHRTTGVCVNTKKCEALSTSDGTFDADQKILDQVLQQALQQLMSGLTSGGQATPPSPSGDYGAPFGDECTTGIFQTSDVSELSNPCAQYVPNVSTTITPGLGDDGGCDIMSSIMGTCGGTTPILVPISSTASNTSPASTSTRPAPRTIFQPTFGGLQVPPGGIRGDILTRFKDATILAGSRDEKNGVEIAGFYGSETFGDQQPQSLVARWCQSRPWASNFLSKIITPSFFDNLCKNRGYQVGIATSTPSQVTLIQKAPIKKATATTTAATSTPTVPPRVDIWASPPSVSLGGRTSIFWNSQGVESCIEWTSDGNFNQKSLSGGAATVPITSDTTFTITCRVSDGSTIIGSVVVGLKI